MKELWRKIRRAFYAWLGRMAAPPEPASGPEPETPAAPEPGAGPETDPAPPAPAIDFRYGGFDGSKAAEDPNTQIGGLTVSKSGMRYKWTRGDLGNWGLGNTDAGALICAFYRDGSRWVGGKFDWISTSRTTRGWENIEGRYNGWEPDKFFGADRVAVCICSKDGRRRTNLAEAPW